MQQGTCYSALLARGPLMSCRVKHNIHNLPKHRQVACDACGYCWQIPSLWEFSVCEVCGRKLEVSPIGGEEVIKEVLQWIGYDWRNMGLTLGDPNEISPAVQADVRRKMNCDRLPFLGIDDSFSWECTHCGNCCKEPLLFDNPNAAKLTEHEALRLHGDPTQRKLKQNPETKACEFWDPSKTRCSIHEKRPLFCRMFPLGTMTLQWSGRNVKFIGVSGPGCPGLENNRMWKIREYLEASGILHKFYK